MNLRITYSTFMVVLWDLMILLIVLFSVDQSTSMEGFATFVIVSNILVWLCAFGFTCLKTKEEIQADIKRKWRAQGLIE